MKATLEEFEIARTNGDGRHNEASHVFFAENGQPFESSSLPYNRWRDVMDSLAIDIDPYTSRHSFVAWRIVTGDDPTLVARDANAYFM